MAASLLGGCGSADQKQTLPAATESSAEGSTTAEAAPAPEKAATAPGEKKQISLWFWSAPADQQVLLKQIIEDDINAVQDDYVLNIEFHAGMIRTSPQRWRLTAGRISSLLQVLPM